MKEVSDYDEIWARIRTVTAWTKQKEMADFLQINPSSIATPKKRGKFPVEWVIKIAFAYEESVTWLLTGDIPDRYSRAGAESRTTARRQPSPLADPLIRDLSLWLKEMTKDNPKWRDWFEIELLHKIPLFAEWRKKNEQPSEDSAAA